MWWVVRFEDHNACLFTRYTFLKDIFFKKQVVRYRKPKSMFVTRGCQSEGSAQLQELLRRKGHYRTSRSLGFLGHTGQIRHWSCRQLCLQSRRNSKSPVFWCARGKVSVSYFFQRKNKERERARIVIVDTFGQRQILVEAGIIFYNDR